ncbi:MAG: tetratricopeptide repeat protein [Flavobacteriaceae bacterium]
MNWTQKNGLIFLVLALTCTATDTLKAQQGWESNALTSAEYYFASGAFGPAAQYYQIYSYYPNLKDKHTAAEFYTLASALRLNTAGAEKMLTAFMIDYPTSYLTETAFFDAANFYFNRGRYSYALKWYAKINENEVAKAQRPTYNFNKAYANFTAKRYKNAKPLFEKVKNIPYYQSDANYYLGYIAYQLEDFEEANRNFDKLNQSSDDNTVGYFQADMNFKLGRFEKAIELARKSLKGADKKESSELSKIIGESYFNLKDYRSALPYLLEYDGKRGKWSNNDYYQLGYAHYRVYDYQNAINQFNKIISSANAVAQNAYYHLADSYLRTDQKTAALNAFKRASEMNFDSVIQQDALLNYARLGYEIGNAYESPSSVLQRFLKTYPKSENVAEVEELLLDSYVNSQNFDAALQLLDKLSSSEFDEARQKVAYMKATSLYKSGQFRAAITYYSTAEKAGKSQRISAAAKYWQAQAYFELKEYDSALEAFFEAKSAPNFQSLEGANRYAYHLGYCYFQLKNYPQAIKAFTDFVSQNPAVSYQRDARLRLGDSHFVLKAYWPAMENYQEATRLNPQKATYAIYQQALSYGFVDRLSKKIEFLNRLITEFPNSPLRDDCYYQLALSHTKQKNNQAALSAYDVLITQFPESPYRSKAYLNKGLIQFNLEEISAAEQTLKQLVQHYPNETTAQQALQIVREIAIEQNTVDAFSQWLKSVEVTSIADLQLEKAAFDAIERLLNAGKKKALKKALENYLDDYPNGGNSLRASFLLAELAFEKEAWEEAALYFEKVSNLPFNDYTEQALVRSTQTLLQLDQREKAYPIWQRLEEVAQFDENKRYAQFNLMQYYFETAAYQETVDYAQEILTLPNLEERVKWDAYYFLANAAVALKNTSLAQQAYGELENAPQGEWAVEALYFSAELKHRDRAYAASNKIIEKIAQNYGGYPEWGAKSLLLMSKNFYQLDDAFQASFILESILENFTQFPEIIKHAKADLDNIKLVEAKNSSSINIDNTSND